MKTFFRFFALLLSLVLILTFAACEAADKDEIAGTAPSDIGFDTGTTAPGQPDSGLTEKKIIRTAHITAETKNYADAAQSIRTLLTTLGGYTESSETVSSSDNTHRLYATFRIPSDQLDTFLAEAGNTVHILSSGIETKDITSDYYDAEARLTTLKAEKAALDAMLANAATTAELLQIHERLYDVMEEIDSLTARLNVYRDEVAMSTVTLTLSEVAELTETEAYGTRVGNAFRDGWAAFAAFFAAFFLWIVRALPVLLLLAAIGVGLFFLIRHLNRKHLPPPPPSDHH